MNISYVSGEWLHRAEACISIQDRGFRFGDGAFETIPVHAGIPYLWDYHMERLAGGLRALAIAQPACDLRALAQELWEANQAKECLTRIAVSRGAGGRGYSPPPEATQPTVVMELFPLPELPAKPVTLWRSRLEKISPRALPTQYKLSQGVNSTLARMEATRNDCYDALQLDDSGYIAEAGSSNIYWLTGHTLHTPSLATGALAGVTRRRLMEISPYPVHEGLYRLEEMISAQAVILTNAALGILAVDALSPENAGWDSAELATELNKLRQHDITSLARA